MDKKEQVTQWVYKKIGKVLNDDIKQKIIEENSSFDVESYVNDLLDKYFNENDTENLKESLNNNSYNDLYYFESDNSSDEQNSIQNSLGFESNEYQTFPLEEIIENLENDSEEVKKKYLEVLEISAEDLITQNFWNKIVEVLQKNLKTENEEILNLILKIFQKFLKCPKKPQLICKGFTSVAEITANQIYIFNSKAEPSQDIKEAQAPERKSSGFENIIFRTSKSSNLINPEIMIKLMWLLIDCQQQIRLKGVRFNENKFREIIFSFIHLLSSTTFASENLIVSGLEIVSVLDPNASWCKYWCHTAVGRTLLCSALRKYKNFFIHIIEIMLKHIKIMKPNRLPSVVKSISLNENSSKLKNFSEVSKPFKGYKTINIDDPVGKEKLSKKNLLSDRYNFICSAPGKHTQNHNAKNQGLNKTKKEAPEWIIKGIPQRVVNEAVFFHSVSLISCLIQFRSGRALFPIQTATQKRLLNVQDLSFLIIEHFENFEYYKCENFEVGYTSAYRSKVLEILNNLKKIKTHINSSRMSSERQKFSYL